MNSNWLTPFIALFIVAICASELHSQAGSEVRPGEQPEKSETEIIIIEKTVGKDGQVTTTKTVTKGNFTDEEIDRIVEGEMNAVDEFAQHQSPEKTAYLGVALKETAEQGVLVSHVEEGSPADEIGLEEYDIITAISGTEVNSPMEIIELVREYEPGDEVEITYTRDGPPATVKATLASRASSERFNSRRDEYHSEKWYEQEQVEKLEKELEMKSGKPRLGVGIDNNEGGRVTVNEVYPGSLAEQADLHNGDVIVSFGGVEVSTTEDLIEAVKAAPTGVDQLIVVDRNGERVEKHVKFEK